MFDWSAEFKNKRVLISGASRGLGREMVNFFAAHGAKVAFNYAGDQESANSLEAQLEDQKCTYLSFQQSVTDEEGVDAMVDHIEKEWDGIDILINNAGIICPLPLALMDVEDWDRVVKVNLTGQFIMARSVLRGMIRNKSGKILNISSLAGMTLIESPIHYAASKAGLKGFTETLSKEISRYKIQVNCLAPGHIKGGLGDNFPEHRMQEFHNHIALHRSANFPEVASCAAFMVSNYNSYMNGATVRIDGGF